MFQSLFPQLDLVTLRLEACRRVALFAMPDPNQDIVEFRHFRVDTRVRGVSRPLRKFLNSGNLKRLSQCEDVADLVLGAGDGATSDSEAEDLPGSRATLPAAFRGNSKNSEVAVRLTEVGPRLTLRLIRIQEGLFRGNVVLHALYKKTSK